MSTDAGLAAAPGTAALRRQPVAATRFGAWRHRRQWSTPQRPKGATRAVNDAGRQVDDYSKRRLKQGLMHLGPVLSLIYFCLFALAVVIYYRDESLLWPLAIVLLVAAFEAARLIRYARQRK